jgi:hypothetical protein
MKRSSNYSLYAGGLHERGYMLGAELGVGMMEAEKRGACDLRSGIHLRSPRRFFTSNEPDLTSSLQVPQALRRSHCSDNPFNSRVIDLQAVNQINNQNVIAPNRDNQRNKRTVDGIHQPHHTQDFEHVPAKGIRD